MPNDDTQPAVSRFAADRPPELPTLRGPRWLVVGNLVALALIVTLSTVALSASRRSFESRALDATDNLARSLQQAIESELDRLDMLLRGIATDYTRSSPDSAALAQLLELRQPLMDADLESLRATDAQGIVREGGSTERAAPLDLSDREFFRLARDDQHQRLVFTGPLQTRTAPRWVVVMARRLDRADGSFGGVVYAHVGIDHFSKRLSSVGLGSDGAISLRTTWDPLESTCRHASLSIL